MGSPARDHMEGMGPEGLHHQSRQDNIKKKKERVRKRERRKERKGKRRERTFQEEEQGNFPFFMRQE